MSFPSVQKTASKLLIERPMILRREDGYKFIELDSFNNDATTMSKSQECAIIEFQKQLHAKNIGCVTCTIDLITILKITIPVGSDIIVDPGLIMGGVSGEVFFVNDQPSFYILCETQEESKDNKGFGFSSFKFW